MDRNFSLDEVPIDIMVDISQGIWDQLCWMVEPPISEKIATRPTSEWKQDEVLHIFWLFQHVSTLKWFARLNGEIVFSDLPKQFDAWCEPHVAAWRQNLYVRRVLSGEFVQATSPTCRWGNLEMWWFPSMGGTPLRPKWTIHKGKPYENGWLGVRLFENHLNVVLVCSSLKWIDHHSHSRYRWLYHVKSQLLRD